MTLRERAGLAFLHRLDPERAHSFAIHALRYGLVPTSRPITSQHLETNLAGLTLPNPVGLAAGFDKNAEVIGPLSNCGFGFIEIGAVTPRPQPGNPRPRLFRLTKDRAAINRFGFNNEGADIIASRLAKRDRSAGIVGVNLGANKDSDNKASDFADVLRTTGPYSDFATVNVSSPNTEKLRDLQGKDALKALLETVLDARAKLPTAIPVFLKIAPDLNGHQMDDIASVAIESGISGIFATNTTLARDELSGVHANEAGGLSGKPLMAPSTAILREMAQRVGHVMPLVGIGGISTVEDILEKFDAGATAVQLYTALVFEGMGLVPRLARELEAQLQVNDPRR